MADDYASTTSTTGTLKIGGSTPGRFDTIGDSDWFKIQLTAGQQVSFSLTASVSMAMVTLRNSNGGQVGTGFWQSITPGGAALTYTPTQSGAFYVEVMSPMATGTYAVSAASGTLPIVGTPCDDSLLGTNTGEQINGLAGNDFIIGLDGADTIDGGAGTDTVMYDYLTATGPITFVAGTSIVDSSGATDTLTGIESFSIMGGKYADKISGSAGADMLYGGAGKDVLSGLGGNDMFMGGVGADKINGGGGIDTVIYDYSAKTSALSFAPGTTITDEKGALDTLTSIEQYYVTGTLFADNLTGGAKNDVFYGNAGADTINGGNGLDTAGYIFSSSAIGITFAAGPSIIDESGATDTLLSIEKFAVEGSNYNDRITGGTGGDMLSGGGGNDSLVGARGNDILDGGAGKDKINGGAGNDTIMGGLGLDRLTGGAGADIFGYAGNLPLFGSDLKGDTITDFTVGVDKIGLCKVDANSSLAGFQQFTFIGTAAFSSTPGELHYRTTATSTIIEADLNGDQVAELSITLAGLKALTSDDFII